jgi:hypothetical protein
MFNFGQPKTVGDWVVHIDRRYISYLVDASAVRVVNAASSTGSMNEARITLE